MKTPPTITVTSAPLTLAVLKRRATLVAALTLTLPLLTLTTSLMTTALISVTPMTFAKKIPALMPHMVLLILMPTVITLTLCMVTADMKVDTLLTVTADMKVDTTCY